MSDNPLKSMKLFPRNLTARADAVVRGNPVTTRPEGGVDNSWPGLEFDHRGMEKFFFPGLVFEFHDERATILREFDPKSAAAKFFKQSDIQKGIYLAFLQGPVVDRSRDPVAEQHVFSFIPPAALENWRVVRDLEPGLIGVALCRQDVYDEVRANIWGIADVTPWFDRRTNRRENGFVLLFGSRANYLNADGVIDPKLVPPGDLTRSMCSPWQYDFTDCGCFFWAANKPDMVSSDEQRQQILNFQRRDRSKDAKRKPTDWILKDNGNWDAVNMLRHVDVIQHFERLKFVIAGHEVEEYVPVPARKPFRYLTRNQIIARLKVLVTVEHALAVEYLYAYYSLKLPPGSGPQREPWLAAGRPPSLTNVQSRIFTAADEVLQVAIDEMRHFRWANEMLIDLGQRWSLDRAANIGPDFPEQKGFNQPFELKPLTAAQLAWFVKVEKASANTIDSSTIPGMYTRILRSVEEGPAFAKTPALRESLSQKVKIIIDEGMDHYGRFLRAQAALSGIPESEYLSVRSAPKPARAGSPDKMLQDTADASYVVLLRALDYVFSQGKNQRGALLEAARRGMYNVDDVCRSLAQKGLGALFTLPPALTSATRANSAHDIGTPLRAQIHAMRTGGPPELVALADRMDGKLATLTNSIGAAP